MATRQRVSIKAAVRDAVREDTQARKTLQNAVTEDSFVNFAHKLGMGADNALTTSSYGFNPITRNRTLLEWIHRGSWLGGRVVDVIAEDMTRRGVTYKTEMDTADQEQIDRVIKAYGVWDKLCETIQWGRLYGGSIAVALIDGQDPRTPLRLEAIGPGQFKGLIAFDRWQVDPTLEDLVTDYGPDLGKPRYYRVGSNAPALRGEVVHYSRVMVRHVGVKLPYQQQLQEQLWGISIIERLYDRMVGFDSASTGAAQLIFKSWLRTLSVDGLRDIVAAGGKPLAGLTAYVENMRRYQGIEGVSMIDVKDKFETQSNSAFSGIDPILGRLAEQLSGATEIPLVRLFGQTPGGLNTDGDSALATYYDSIGSRQARDLGFGVHIIYQLAARSKGIVLPTDFELEFRSLYEMDEEQKANIAKTSTETVLSVYGEGVISDQTLLKELHSISRITGLFSNIGADEIAAATNMLPLPELPPALGGPALPGAPGADPTQQGALNAGPNGQTPPLDTSTRSRVPLQPEAQ